MVEMEEEVKLVGLFLMFIYFWEEGRGRERDTHRIQSGLRADSREPIAGLELTNCEIEIMTWAEVRCLANWATQAPLHTCVLKWAEATTYKQNKTKQNNELREKVLSQGYIIKTIGGFMLFAFCHVESCTTYKTIVSRVLIYLLCSAS